MAGSPPTLRARGDVDAAKVKETYSFMLLADTFTNRTPQAFGDPELGVRSVMASLYLSRKINLHVLARRNDITLIDRWMVIQSARSIERLFRKYQSLAREFRFDYLVINTRILEIAACSIATHIIKGEYEQARRRGTEALGTEAELSERTVRRARESAERSALAA